MEAEPYVLDCGVVLVVKSRTGLESHTELVVGEPSVEYTGSLVCTVLAEYLDTRWHDSVWSSRIESSIRRPFSPLELLR